MGYVLLAGLAFAAVVVVVWPWLRRPTKAAAPPAPESDELAELKERKAGLVRALQELEDEYRSGQISEDEYRSLQEEYQRRAVQAIKDLERLPGAVPQPQLSPEPAPPAAVAPGQKQLSRAIALAVLAGLSVLAGVGWWELGPGRVDQALEAEREHRQALERLRAVVAENPGDHLARSQLALLYYQVGEREQALAELDTVLAADPNFLVAIYDRALIARVEQDFPTLIQFYRRFLEVAPEEREIPGKYPQGLIDQLLTTVQDDIDQLRQILAASGAGSPPGETTADVADGQALYAQYCAGCHGSSAQGGLGPALRNNQFIMGAGPEATERVIRNGRGSMPAWGSLLSDQQISALVEYLVSLNR